MIDSRKFVSVRITTGIYLTGEDVQYLTPYRGTPRQAAQHIRDFWDSVGDVDTFGHVTLSDGREVSCRDFIEEVSYLDA